MLMQGMRYMYDNPPSVWQNINNVLMLAADINDAALQIPDGQYVGTGWAIARLSNQVTVYYSITDPELALSAVTYIDYHNPDYPGRLGMEGPFSFEQGALTVNTYGVDCNWVVNPANIAWLKLEEIIPWYVLEHFLVHLHTSNPHGHDADHERHRAVRRGQPHVSGRARRPIV